MMKFKELLNKPEIVAAVITSICVLVAAIISVSDFSSPSLKILSVELVEEGNRKAIEVVIYNKGDKELPLTSIDMNVQLEGLPIAALGKVEYQLNDVAFVEMAKLIGSVKKEGERTIRRLAGEFE